MMQRYLDISTKSFLILFILKLWNSDNLSKRIRDIFKKIFLFFFSMDSVSQDIMIHRGDPGHQNEIDRMICRRQKD